MNELLKTYLVIIIFNVLFATKVFVLQDIASQDKLSDAIGS